MMLPRKPTIEELEDIFRPPFPVTKKEDAYADDTQNSQEQ